MILEEGRAIQDTRSWIRPLSLLLIYSIIPLVGIFLIVDWFFFNFEITRSLPVDPHSMQWFNMFFMLPHIFASFFTFFDAEYVQYYKRRLLVSVFTIMCILVLVFSFRLFAPFMLLISIYTVYHLVSQQTGIAAMLARNQSVVHKLWKWATFLAMAVFYLAVIVGGTQTKTILIKIFPFFYFLYFLLVCVTVMKSFDRIGRYYIIANSVMIIFSCILYSCDFYFFMILIPRFVHDVTAFFFYISHNTNRNAGRPLNLVSRVGASLKLPEYLYTPLAGIACTALATALLKDYLFLLLSFMALFHYYWEGVMWKQGTPHRRHIHIGVPQA